MKPNYKGFIEPPNEPDYRDFGSEKYLWNRKDFKGKPVYPGLDEVTRKFAENKQNDYKRIKKWQQKEFTGFK
jgi:hypothetical protein